MITQGRIPVESVEIENFEILLKEKQVVDRWISDANSGFSYTFSRRNLYPFRV